jgi:hypothetical protein
MVIERYELTHITKFFELAETKFTEIIDMEKWLTKHYGYTYPQRMLVSDYGKIMKEMGELPEKE